MFSENRKISSRQAAALFQADWLGRLVLFLPLLVQGKSKGAVLVGGIAGIFLTAVLLGVFCTGAREGERDYYGSVCRAAGRFYGNLLYLVYVLYFLLQTGILLYLCSAAARLYLLPDVPFWVLPLLPGIAGIYLAGGGMEVRGRLSQMLSGFVGILLLLLLAVSLLQIKGERLLEAQQFSFLETLETAVFWAGSFGDIGILPMVLSVTQKEKGWKRRLYQTLGFSGLILLLVFLGGYGIFGQAGMGRLEWPVLSLMSTSNLQGVFFQRWDVLAVGLLMVSLFLAVGSGLYYLGIAGTCLLGEAQREKETAKEEVTIENGTIEGNRKNAAGKGARKEKNRIAAKERGRKKSGEIREQGIRIAGFLGAYGLSLTLLFWPEGRMGAGRLGCFLLAPLMIVLVLLVRPIQRVRWRKRRAKWRQ